MTDKKAKALPSKAWYTLEEVAQRWGCAVGDVAHYGEAGMLRLSIIPSGFSGFEWIDFNDPDCKRFDQKTTAEVFAEISGPQKPLGLSAKNIGSIRQKNSAPFLECRPAVMKDDELGISNRGASENGALKENYSINDLFIVTEELDRFEKKHRIGAHAGELPKSEQTAKWPWGTHETKLLHDLAEAAKRFWVNFEPGEPDTAPTNETVTKFLKERGVSERVAAAMATILRAEGLPAGRKG
jgi:hypothetical protein